MGKSAMLNLLLLLILTANRLSAQDPKAELEKRLFSEFTLTKTTAQRDDIVTPGSTLVLHKDGLIMFSTDSRVPAPVTYKNGKLSITFGDAMGTTMLLGSNQTASTVPQRKFVSGEKFWLTGTQVSDKQVVLQVFSDAYANLRYFGQIKFPFPKNNFPSPDDMMKAISEVVTAEPENANAAPDQQPDTSQQEPTKTIAIGQTTDEVVAILGQPQKRVNLGAKEIYIYSDMKVTFMNGKVSDVQ
jgi:hypothetical protein